MSSNGGAALWTESKCALIEVDGFVKVFWSTALLKVSVESVRKDVHLWGRSMDSPRSSDLLRCLKRVLSPFARMLNGLKFFGSSLCNMKPTFLIVRRSTYT